MRAQSKVIAWRPLEGIEIQGIIALSKKLVFKKKIYKWIKIQAFE